MAKKFSFENVHKNKKLAFLDGLLTGIVSTIVVGSIIRDSRELKKFELELKDARDTISQPAPTLKTE